MNPSVKILNPDLRLLTEIDLYTALDFRRSWQDIGDFTIRVVGDNDALCKGNIIMLDGDGHRCGVIDNIEKDHSEKGVYVTVAGKTLNGLTKRRIVLPSDASEDGGYFCVPPASSDNLYTSAENIIKTLASSCFGSTAIQSRRFPHTVIAADQNRGIQTNWSSRYRELSDELTSICQYCDCGYEFYIDLTSRQYVFDYSPGVDRSASQNVNSRVFFSMEFDSVTNLTYTENSSQYKNLAYCGGTGEGSDRVILAVAQRNSLTSPEGFERREIFIDCGNAEAAETETAISLQQEGIKKLDNYNEKETFNATIAEFGSFRYLEHWDLGDLVTVRDVELGLLQDKRIVEVRESYEPDREQITATLGDMPVRLGRALARTQSPIKYR